jgi:exodeoxyribonuclease VII large subunit
MEPKGVGALQLAYEALKRKLATEGLFDSDRKKPIPFLPRIVGVITSPTGAAIRDIVKTLWNRFPNLEIRFCPVRVQGEGSAQEIVDALEAFNKDGQADVIVVGRGGGSLEDLWAFNEESVARAIHASRIPVVSAVGHEIDFTIADFVADLRASTPSSAAEIVVPEKVLLVLQISGMVSRVIRFQEIFLQKNREKVHSLSARIVSPGKRIQEYRIRLDERYERLCSSIYNSMEDLHRRITAGKERIFWFGPSTKLQTLAIRLDGMHKALSRAMLFYIEEQRKNFSTLMSCLESMSPLGVLARGYSITRALPDRKVVRSSKDVCVGDHVEVIVFQGALECAVEDVKESNGV